MSKTFQTVTTIIIAILAFFTILFTIMGVFEMVDSMRLYTVSEDSLIYALEDGRYGDLVESYHRNLVSDVKTTDVKLDHRNRHSYEHKGDHEGKTV